MTTPNDDLLALQAAIERHCITRHAEPVRLNSGGFSNYYCDLKGVTLHHIHCPVESLVE